MNTRDLSIRLRTNTGMTRKDLTNGFIKKTNKTPMAEKILVQKYKDDYERRYGNEQLQGL